ncbi:MAG: ribosome maturation factor RimP [Gammaproteobacteria bacterium]|nr:ribosome maturation factor RimP [Gammaproteobacteria bacterium]
MRRATESVWSLLEPEVKGLGYEFVGALFGQAENGMTLRVYIDRDDGIVLDDCATVSRQLSALLDVENVIDVAYLLEVSSPGLDRPLFTEEQFVRQIGQQVRIRMQTMVSKRRKFLGEIVAVESNRIVVEQDEQSFTLSIDDMESARLVPAY